MLPRAALLAALIAMAAPTLAQAAADDPFSSAAADDLMAAAAPALPAGFTDTTRVERPRHPDHAALRPRRPRVRRAQERHRQRLRQHERPDADGLRGPAPERRRLPGSRAARPRRRPAVHPGPAVHLRPLQLRQGPELAAVPALERQLPRSARRRRRRLRDHRPAVADRARRRRDGADRRLVQPVLLAHGRRAELRPGRRAVRLGAATARRSRSPTTARPARPSTPAGIRPAASAAR